MRTRTVTATANANTITAIIVSVPFTPVPGELPGIVVIVLLAEFVVAELPPEGTVVVSIPLPPDTPLPSTSSLPTAEGCLVVVVIEVVVIVVVVDVVETGILSSIISILLMSVISCSIPFILIEVILPFSSVNSISFATRYPVGAASS